MYGCLLVGHAEYHFGIVAIGEELVGERFKERPADCVIDSHAIMVKGGYIKYMANGIYSSYLPLRRIVRKIEQILREEMDKIDGQEVQFPVVMPASLWDESGPLKRSPTNFSSFIF